MYMHTVGVQVHVLTVRGPATPNGLSLNVNKINNDAHMRLDCVALYMNNLYTCVYVHTCVPSIAVMEMLLSFISPSTTWCICTCTNMYM